ncbi:hypothetical protein K402DRAFT_424087 [Aulographum hederae CBS 113979]|uniref:Uncharacterized protein n=1 Tax=Aulographum hederae CBS 113979 TaxID=1176131 RepID=A0A6G1GQR7_9PEZI|nr:hypothetical protein K402DRAFT_424087 [Aulographum hederae CBS 113979]
MKTSTILTLAPLVGLALAAPSARYSHDIQTFARRDGPAGAHDEPAGGESHEGMDMGGEPAEGGHGGMSMPKGPSSFAELMEPGGIMDSIMPKGLKVMSTKQLTAETKVAGAKRMRIRYGPFKLKPSGSPQPWNPARMDPDGNEFSYIAEGFPKDVTILTTNSTLEYSNGTEADVNNGVYNHHFLFANQNKQAVNPIGCSNGNTSSGLPMSVIGGASEANRNTQFYVPDGSQNIGYYVSPNDQVRISSELANYSPIEKDIYEVTDIEYVEGKVPGSLESNLQQLSVTTCLGNAEMVEAPAGKKQFSFTADKLVIDKPGYILYRRGHLHDGGNDVSLTHNGKNICTSKAIYGGPKHTTVIDGKKWETIGEMTSCEDAVEVKPGDTLAVTASYDLDAHPAREHSGGGGMGGEMGLMVIMFAPK